MKNISDSETVELLRVTNIITRIGLHKLDATEFACLKALSVFKSSKFTRKVSTEVVAV